MSSKYLALKQKHQKEVNEFPMFFAFNQKQFEKGMAGFGLTPEDTDKIYSLNGTGGYYLRTDAPKLHEMFDRHEKEMSDAVNADQSGEGFIFEMFDYELGNHEFSYTGDIEPTLDALGLSAEEVNSNPALLHGLKKAVQAQRRE